MRRRTIILCLMLIAIGSSVIGSEGDSPIFAARKSGQSPSARKSGQSPSSAWYKGNTHCHSLWSDGDEFPEMVADWYKTHGYQFLGLSDHNILMRGQRWIDVATKKRTIAAQTMAACRKRFGDPWLETRGQGEMLQVRLKTLQEFRGKLEEPGKFLLVENEEISGKWQGHQIHLNALNLAEEIKPQEGSSVVDTLRLDVQAICRQAERAGRTILVCANHPNWAWYDISPEDLAQAVELQFFEVYNGFGDANNPGDAVHPGAERIWDIANTMRIGKLRQPPLYGVAADDTHNYHSLGPKKANPGRAWIVVRAKELSAAALVEAMTRGDFYASTGVTLRDVAYDAKQAALSVEVAGEPNTQYTIEFIGTLAGADPTGQQIVAPEPPGKPPRTLRRYSPEVGKVLSTVRGTSATYKFRGNELYVRAVVRCDKSMANPPEDGPGNQQAWCQPVGWQERLQRSSEK